MQAEDNKAKHGDSFFVAASPSLQSCACWRRYMLLASWVSMVAAKYVCWKTKGDIVYRFLKLH